MCAALVPFLLALGFVACTEPISSDVPIDTEDPGGSAHIYLPETTLDFGEVAFGDNVSGLLAVENMGSADLVLSSVVTTAPFVSNYANALTIPAGGSTSLTIRYQAADYEPDTGTVTLQCNDADPAEQTVVVDLVAAVITDADGDGYDIEDAGGDDCDDTDAEVHPNAGEQWYDGVDEDCDGLNDYDRDQDGYTHENYGGGDCNDTRSDIYPGAADAWYDNVDSDCDGGDDWDADFDGYASTSGSHGPDCDDTDPNVNPDALEGLDGKDNDCDGKLDWNALAAEAPYTLVGTTSSEQAGWAMATVDVTGEGVADLVVGAPSYGTGSNATRGAFFVYPSDGLPADGSDLEEADWYLQGSGTADLLGYALAVPGDFDGDGQEEFFVGAPGTASNAGAAYLVNGPDLVASGVRGSNMDASHAYLTLSGSGSTYVGRGAFDDLDLDSDGLADLAGYYVESSGNALFLLYGGSDAGSLSYTSADARFLMGESSSTTYDNVGGVGDFDGDGHDDLLVCSPTFTHEDSSDGVVTILWGSTTRESNSSATSFYDVYGVLGSGDRSDNYGHLCTAQPDVDRDGRDEVWVYGANQTTLYFFHGDDDLHAEGSLDPAETADYYYFSSSMTDAMRMHPAGDWTGDGVSELALSFAATSMTAGSVYLYDATATRGMMDGDAYSSALASAMGDEEYGGVAFGVGLMSRPGDLDGDGDHDLVIGDYGWADPSGSSTTAGAVFVSWGNVVP